MYPGKYTASIMLALGLMAPITSWAGGTLPNLRNQAEHSPAALQQLERQASTGDRAAQYYLGTLYDPSLKLGRAEASDWNRALYWYQNVVQSQNDPITCYPDKAMAHTPAQATAWWRAEAEQSLKSGNNDNGHC
jgi:hypothetical protein